MPELVLEGCTPEPLMSYLKALGILRLVSEQADPQARACWRNDLFVLQSSLDRQGLIDFFLNRYQPSPIVAPWGARSGFYRSSSERTAREALKTLMSSKNPQLEFYSKVVNEVEKLLHELEFQEKAQDDAQKLQLMIACRDRLPEEILPWLDACYVLTAMGRKYPPLLGTGGNEGSGSYVSGFAQCLVECLVKRSQENALKVSLFGEKAPGVATDQMPGHFAPGASGGANAGQGFSGPLTTNRWDYILGLEGTCLWASSVVRRLEQHDLNIASFPFTVNVSGAGGTSLALRDSCKPKDAKRPVAEIWLPIWSRPATLAEIRQLLSEGRASVGRQPAQTGLDLALAASTLGVDRGIREFQRIIFLMRNGQSFLGISQGVISVGQRQQAHLLQEIHQWLYRLRSACRVGQKGTGAPPRFLRTLHLIEHKIFDFCRYGGNSFFQKVFIALGRAERQLALSAGKIGDSVVPPVPELSAQWLHESNDASVEFEIAVALAGIYGQKDKIGPLRIHLEPVDWQQGRIRWADQGRSVVWSFADLASNLAAVLERRLMEAQKANCQSLPLASVAPASLEAVSLFLAGQTDDSKIEDLLWGGILVHSDRLRFPPRSDAPPLPRAYALLKLLFLPTPLRIGPMEYSIRPEPRIIPLLCAGRIGHACQIALRRLRASGLLPIPFARAGTASRDADWLEADFHSGLGPGLAAVGKRLAAALLIPISTSSAIKLTKLVLRPTGSVETLVPEKEEQNHDD